MTRHTSPGPALPCRSCGARAVFLCDYPVKRDGHGDRCGRPLCAAHATPVAGVAHYCPAHDRASRAPTVESNADRPRIPGFDP